MAAFLVLVVLAGAALVAVGGRLVVKRWDTPGNSNVVPGGKGGLLVIIGALAVIIATPPMLNQLYPEETTASSPAPEPSATPSAMDMGDHSHGGQAQEETSPSPSPTEAESPAPAPAEAVPSPAAPSPTPTARHTATRTPARGRTGTTGRPAAPAPAHSSPPAPPEPPAPEPSPVPPESPAPPAPPAPSPPIELPSPPPPSPTPPAASPSPAPSPQPTFVVTVTCSALHSKMHRGDQFTMTYDFDATSARKVGLGTALVDSDGHNRSDGSGNKDSVAVAAGHTKVDRRITIPSDFPRRTYEAIGQVWPEHHVDDHDAKVIAQDSCGHFEVIS